MVTRKDYHYQETDAYVVGQPCGHIVPDTFATGDDDDKIGSYNPQCIEDPHSRYTDVKEDYC